MRRLRKSSALSALERELRHESPALLPDPSRSPASLWLSSEEIVKASDADAESDESSESRVSRRARPKVGGAGPASRDPCCGRWSSWRRW